MEILNIEKIDDYGDSLNVILKVKFTVEETHKWELTDPLVEVAYSPKDGVVMRAELIDEGMKVHGYDFSDWDIRKIENFLKRIIK